MYVPPQFREDRPEILAAAVRDLQLAVLVTATGAGYAASHIPMVLKDEPGGAVLEGHVARQNDHWRCLATPQPSLAVFQGPHAYISPGWYETKREHGRVVPTWNYVAIHAEGPLEIVEDAAWLRSHLDDLTRANERHRDEPWQVSDAPAEFIDNLARAIVGLRLRVERWTGAWKMIQHRPEGDRLGTMAGLSAEASAGGRAVAAIMREHEAARPGAVPT